MSKKNGDFNWAESISLKDYFDTKLCGMERATNLARDSMEKRLESMNEFRQSLKDQSSTFLTRQEYDAKHALLEQKIETLQKFVWLGIGILTIMEIVIRFYIK
jgi:hypothetical protein